MFCTRLSQITSKKVRKNRSMCSTHQFIWVVSHYVSVDGFWRRFHVPRTEIFRKRSILTDERPLNSGHRKLICFPQTQMITREKLMKEHRVNEQILEYMSSNATNFSRSLAFVTRFLLLTFRLVPCSRLR